jgi:hypothetical protein
LGNNDAKDLSWRMDWVINLGDGGGRGIFRKGGK